MEIVINGVLLVIGFIMLIKGADLFVEGAAKIADKFGIPQLIIGLTIVAMGTSLPEAAVSISAVLKESAESSSAAISLGNVLGSNIMNILLILGITSIIRTIAVQKSTILCEIPFMIGITILLVGIGYFDGSVVFTDGIILWGCFIAYFIYLFRNAKGNMSLEEDDIETNGKNDKIGKLIFFVILGVLCIVFGSDITVNAATELARSFGMSERLIGLTIVAFGTSLPELITAATAALKGKADIAIGNVVGSNIFNILFVLGTTSLITTVPYADTFKIDSIVCIGASILLLILVALKKELNRTGGIILLAGYIGYFIYLIG